jgi:uncharacterized membrane protein
LWMKPTSSMRKAFSSILQKIKQQPWLILILLVFAGVFASITFVNHYFFRTYGWDLGINHNAIWDYAHFRWNDCMIMLPHKAFSNVLSDHFSLYPVLIAPFYWVFGTWTMLLLQFLSILFGAWGVYRFVRYLGASPLLGRLALVHFFAFYGIYSALGFDYHDNVVATMFVPWLLLAFHTKNWKQALIFSLLIMIAKENMALWLVFIGFGLFFRGLLTRDKSLLIWSGALSLSALVFFVLVIKVIIPSLALPGGEYMHNSFTALGKDFGEVLKNILLHPIDALKLLVENHLGQVEYDGIKKETYIGLLLAGGAALMFTPEYLIMLLPIIGQKMFNDDPSRWGINYHYSIEFAPILVIAFYTVLLKLPDFKKLFRFVAPQEMQGKKIQVVSGFIGVALCIGSTIHFMDNRVSTWYKRENVKFYSPSHWKQNFNVSETHEIVASIPQDARVSAQSALAPHLAFRDYIYHFPYIGDADYVALFVIDPNPYPMSWEAYEKMIIDMKNSGKWEVFKQNNAVLILKKK